MAETVTHEDAQYALDIVRAICTEVGPGLPGSSQERERAGIIQKEFGSHLGAGNVAVEEFSVAPGGFLSPYPGMLPLLLAAALNISTGRIAGVSPWLTSVPALLFSIVPPVLFVFEFLLGCEMIDPLFEGKRSVNVIGALRKPGIERVRRLLILSGHHDSAPENAWLRLLGYGFYFISATYFIGLLTMLLMSIMQLTGLVAGDAGLVRAGTLGWGLVAYPIVPAILFLPLATWRRKGGGVVPGAIDNLSGSALAVAMCRFLVKNPSHIPADIEIRLISFGSEEAGLRGSRRYVERHLDELKRLDARLLNFEMVAHPQMAILTSDVNGTMKHSPDAVKSAVAAAQRAGVPYKERSAYIGVGTDAASFSRAGLRATSLLPFRVPQQQIAFYHQRRDTPEALTIEPLFNALRLALEWVRSGGE
ncbi:MAG TPA: M28 family peptidase [Anaerolineae bacterium]|nr:M28 family peptidase [Anaerolineae bacterium]